MYDLSRELRTFHNDHVTLTLDHRRDMKGRRDRNRNRIESGLSDLNKSNPSEWINQGGYAQKTMTQPPEGDEDSRYDIDMGVVFDDLDAKAPKTTKGWVFDAIKRKSTQLKNDPELKKKCIRVTYSEGYQCDFPVYRRKSNGNNYIYEIAIGDEWVESDPRSMNSWIEKKIAEKSPSENGRYQLRKIIRFLKYFSKVQSYKLHAKFPGGLLNTALAIECFRPVEGRDYESFYRTLAILGSRSEYSPVYANGVVISDDKDTVRIARLIDAAKNAVSTLDLLQQSSATHNDACNAWNEVFCHSFFESIKVDEKVDSGSYFQDGFTDSWLNNIKRFGILCAVQFPTAWPHIKRPIWKMENRLDVFIRAGISKYKNESVSPIENSQVINRGLWVKFEAMLAVPIPQDFNVMWRVVNTGEQAKYRDSLRGGFYASNNGVVRWEQIQYRGVHWVEAFLIRKRDNICVGKSDRFFIVIE